MTVRTTEGIATSAKLSRPQMAKAFGQPQGAAMVGGVPRPRTVSLCSWARRNRQWGETLCLLEQVQFDWPRKRTRASC